MSTLWKKASARRATRIWAIVVAGVIGIFALSADMLQTAEATSQTDEEGRQPSPEAEASVNLDSLYSAKAADNGVGDSSFVAPVDPGQTIEGHVSWYGSRFHGRKTANGERFNMNDMTAAHKKLPFNSIVRVVDTKTGKAVLVRINDRGPYVGSRVLDLSREAATRLGIRGRGTANGRLEVFVDEERVVESEQGKKSLRFVTFDADVKGAKPTGWSVNVMVSSSFSEALNVHNRLVEQYDQVFLSRVIEGGETNWYVLVGLQSEEHLARDFQLELAETFSESSVVRFDNGLPRKESSPTFASSSSEA
ncbi:MAG: septal ring lytic transglycosylase RlpA family protein [Candidatus Kapaibacterium sp.]